MFALTSSFFLVEITVGYVTNSMALVADSFHMLSDVAALVIAFLSVKMSPRKWSKNTFGWARAEVLGALVNAVFLVALCFSIMVESLKRFYEVEDIHQPDLILYVGALGLLVNIVGLALFHRHGHSHHVHQRPRVAKINEMMGEEDINDNENYSAHNALRGKEATPVKGVHSHENAAHNSQASQLNMRGVFLHILADALGSVIVIISALVIWMTDWEYKFYVDPSLSVVMVVLIMKSTWPLLLESALILLQTVPTHIQVDAIQEKLLKQIDGVLAVHEFHVWQLAGDRIIASAHIRCRNLADYMRIAEKVKEFFHNEGIHSTTIQPEFVEYQDDLDALDCMLDCPPNTRCAASTCCGPTKDSPPPQSPVFLTAGGNCRQRTSTHNLNGSIGGGSGGLCAGEDIISDIDLQTAMESGSLTDPNEHEVRA